MSSPIQPIDRHLLAATLCDLRQARGLISDGASTLSERFEGLSEAALEQVELLAARLEEQHVQLIGLNDERFPVRLRSLRTPPPYLFAAGDLSLLKQRCVGFSGSRNATETALEATAACAEEAHNAGFVVVAGYARGVDGAAHVAAIAAGGKTIAVLPEGILNAKLGVNVGYEDYFPGENFLAISQFQADARWMVGRAMTRNSTVIAISDCLVLMAAQESGGSYEAGKSAMKVDVPVIAPAFSEERSSGAESLCREGALPVDSIDGFRTFLAELQPAPSTDTLF